MEMLSKNEEKGILLNLQMLLDEGEEAWGNYCAHRPGEAPSFSCYLIYCGQRSLRSDVLYLVERGQEGDFPADGFSYLTNGTLKGEAPHVRSIGSSFPELVNRVIRVFDRYGEFQRQLAEVVSRGGTLKELCQVGSRFLGNPLYIHDHLFAILAESHHVPGMIDFEYNERTRSMHIPLWLINEFKFDEAYRSTLASRKASIWGTEQYPHNIRSLYVNLWDQGQYLGRLLINEIGTALLPGHFHAAEFFAGYVIRWLRNQDRREMAGSNFEPTFLELITTGRADPRDLKRIMTVLDWKEEDQFLCLKLTNQSPLSVRSDSALNSRLASMLNGCVTFRQGEALCVIIDLTISRQDAGNLRLQLAPLVRDSLMYAGLSNPVKGLGNLKYGFFQADRALDYITKVDSSDWMVSFSSCALNYIMDSAARGLPDRMTAHPVLADLRNYDEENGTQYYRTLQMYLLQERSIPKTAQALIIHRTTLTYRLNKLLELTRLNLEDANLRLYLMLSYRLLERSRGMQER